MPTPPRRSILINPEALTKNVVAPRFRDDQLVELIGCFSGGIAETRPLHAWIHGPPGTGKTLCVRHVLATAAREKTALCIYVSCRERCSFYSIIEAILEVVKPLRSPYRSRDLQLGILRAELVGRRAVIALDDADVLHRRELSDLLFQLASLSRVSILCVAASRHALLELSPEVLSRFSPRQVLFSRFTSEQITAIARDAAERALRPGAWTTAAIETISGHAYGDARRALGLLRHAVQRAEEERAVRVEVSHLRPPNMLHFNAQAEDELSTLSSHHRLVYDIVASHGRVPAGELEDEYRRKCDGRLVTPVATRTLSSYLTELCQRRLLDREHGPGTPGWTYSLFSDREGVALP